MKTAKLKLRCWGIKEGRFLTDEEKDSFTLSRVYNDPDYIFQEGLGRFDRYNDEIYEGDRVYIFRNDLPKLRWEATIRTRGMKPDVTKKTWERVGHIYDGIVELGKWKAPPKQ